MLLAQALAPASPPHLPNEGASASPLTETTT
jgi:hypothetical protein